MYRLERALAVSSVFIMGFLICAHAVAIPQKSAFKPYGLGASIRSGVVIGGTADQALSILRISKRVGKGGAERLIIVYGDRTGKPLKDKPGYFNIQVDEHPARVSIDLAQVLTTAVDNEELSRIFSGSRLVSETEMTTDPLDRSTNILLTMKRPVEVRAMIKREKGTPLLMVDFKPIKDSNPVKAAGVIRR